jgi:hypothetical protein
MEQMIARLLTEMKALLKAGHEEIAEMLSFQQEIKATTEGSKASKEEIAEMKVWCEEVKACQEPRRTEIKTGLEDVKVTDLEAIQKN